ncbi:VanW family protein [Candidatus Uhrbacteria bacterium]|nr:VanW family protein [Candidatus Uhrbacteria bacterium]
MPALSTKHPLLYKAAVAKGRLLRHARWARTRLATHRQADPLAIRITSHQSTLMRKLGDVDMRLQRNKVTNLRLAADGINGVLIRTGETLSLWKLIGNSTAKRGFLPGILLSNGKILEGVGGGLCQMANLVYWMALHSPLTVTERHRHSYDIFPDSGRTVPFGTGATLFYNYMDLSIKNETDQTFQVMVSLTDEHLKGEIRSEKEWPVSYRLLERAHRFSKDENGAVFRHNEIHRQTIDRTTGNTVSDDLLYKNNCPVLYEVDPSNIG